MRSISETPSTTAWYLLAIATLMSLVAGAAQGFSLPCSQAGVCLVLCGGLLAVAKIGRTRFTSDAMAETCALFAFWIAMLSVLLPASYVAAAFNAAFIDGSLQAWDRALGFDWLALQRWTDRTEWAAKVLVAAYMYSSVQIAVAVFVLAATRDLGRLNIYVTGLLIATLVTVAISAALPALGAYPAYGFVVKPQGAIGTFADVLSFKGDVMALRAGTLRELSGPFQGIITFPSYHTVVAVSAAWATWRVHWIGAVNTAATGVVLISTLPIGGHHLIDLMAGTAVIAASLALARWLEARAAHKGVAAPIYIAEPKSA